MGWQGWLVRALHGSGPPQMDRAALSSIPHPFARLPVALVLVSVQQCTQCPLLLQHQQMSFMSCKGFLPKLLRLCLLLHHCL